MNLTKAKQTVHIVIPDPQVREGVRTDHLTWASKFIQDEYRDVEDLKVICVGDLWDMPSLSSYDKGKKEMEGKRVYADIKAGNRGFTRMNEYLHWLDGSRKFYCFGNHDQGRLEKAIQLDPQLEGILSMDLFDTEDWTRVPFLETLSLNGILYSHYFINSANGRPLSGSIETKLKYMGRSFTQGHLQGLQSSNRSIIGKRTRGLIVGSFYQHNELYRGPQATDEWRGIVVCHNVKNGNYDLCEVSLDYLKKRYYTR